MGEDDGGLELRKGNQMGVREERIKESKERNSDTTRPCECKEKDDARAIQDKKKL